jgi:hypothetical protein
MSSAAALTSGLAVTAFIAELLFGLTTFGAGITFNVAIHLLSLLGLVDGTSKSAVLALALPEAVVGVVQAALFFRGLNVGLLALGIVCFGVSFLPFTQVLFLLNETALVWVTRGLGLLLLLLAIESGVSQHRMHRGHPSWPPVEPPVGTVPDLVHDRRALLCAVGCFCGAGGLGGLTGVAGPPLMLYVRWSGRSLSKQTWRSTSSVFQCLLSIARLTYLLAVRALVIATSADVASHVAVVAAALAGLALGNRYNRALDTATLHRLVLCMLVAGSLMLATTGVHPLDEIAVISLVVAVLLGCPAWLAQRWLARRRDSQLLSSSFATPSRQLNSSLLNSQFEGIPLDFSPLALPPPPPPPTTSQSMPLHHSATTLTLSAVPLETTPPVPDNAEHR